MNAKCATMEWLKKFRDKENTNDSTQDPGRKKLRARQGYLL